MNKRLLLLLTVVIVLSAGILVAMPVLRKLTVQEENVPAPAAPDAYSAADLAVLGELGGLFHRLDSITAFEVTGSVVMFDPADSVGRMKANYHYAKLDSLVYYRLGDQEILSTAALQLVVDHKAEKMFISPPQRFRPALFPAPAIIANFLTGEGYVISRKVKGGLNWITLERANHISCKEFRVGFDNAGFIRQTYSRLTDQSDPLNEAKDKIMEAYAEKWTITDPAVGIFDASRLLTKTPEGFQPAPAFQNYALIVTR